ncbi:hypothetical protein B0H15DRAFT_823851 [Mycena belliarum]|uniref:Fe2OG dioxygenase domain-containing protein n=1 Tax=Mycena belliarum TaxID=1033014 RepID=A0AAD6UBH4_9AGAR|nr:hypothetical protein B0H15DRAFT_823851 [Mycena belliae]
MGKKNKSARRVEATAEASVAFPDISLKYDLECHTLLEDQILVIDDILSAAECQSFVKFIDGLPLELTPPKKRGEAERHNHRYSVTSVEFAERLHAVFAPHLPLFPQAARGSKATTSPRVARKAHSFNSNIRVYKYTPLQHFGPHYDDDCRDPATGAKSEWTLLIYLTGCEDGVEGGETLFYQDGKCTSSNVIKASLTRGTALLHRHGHECMLHEGSPVIRGVKYVLRSDVMFIE